MKKKFDCIAFQRKAREELSRQYNADKDKFIRKLKEKYRHLRKKKVV